MYVLYVQLYSSLLVGRNVFFSFLLFLITSAFYHTTDTTEIQEALVDRFTQVPSGDIKVSDRTGHFLLSSWFFGVGYIDHFG